MPAIQEITGTEIEQLDERRFVEMMNRLLWAEGARAKIPNLNIETSLRLHDKDRGIDARVTSAADVKCQIPTGLTVWQFKKGKPDKRTILAEVKKPGVQEALKAGATYCLVLSADLNPAMRDTRKAWIGAAFEQMGTDAPYLLMTGSQVAAWAGEHPVFLLHLGRPVAGLWRLDQWRDTQVAHQVEFQFDDARHDLLSTLRERMNADSGPFHSHVNGLSGVGKTRLALEVFEDRADLVLYAQEPMQGSEIFQWMAYNPKCYATLVVDECDYATAKKLAEAAAMSEGRLRLLTVGQAKLPGEGANIYTLEPLDDEAMARVVRGVSSAIGPEQARWIARVSRGYVKLATGLAERVAQGAVTIGELTSSEEFGLILQRLIPDESQRVALRGLALMDQVGWEGDVSSEGEAIAKFVGIPWNEMRRHIAEAERQNLAQRRGRYRYVTPDLVALWLAAEEWSLRKEDLLGFMAEELSESAKDRMWARLAELGFLEEAISTVEEVLGPNGPFDSIDVLDSERGSDWFSKVAHGSPVAALAALERLIVPLSKERLVDFRKGRRNVIWTLESLAWSRGTFFGAARLLLQLAESENESLGNNATGVWKGLFLTHVAGTEVPAMERYVLLEEALASDSLSARLLALDALSEALATHEFGGLVGEQGGGTVPKERWRPHSMDEDHNCRRAAFGLLEQALHDEDDGVKSRAYQLLFDSLRNLIRHGLADEAIDSVANLTIAENDDLRRHQAWEGIVACLKYEGERLSDVQKTRLEQIAELYMSNSLHDRLRRFVGRWSHTDWKGSKAPEEERTEYITAHLADEAMEDQETLKAELKWLVSGEAENVHYFGYRIGQLDGDHTWLPDLLEATRGGSDYRLVSNYLRARADAKDTEWYENTLDEWALDETLALLVLDATWRGESSPRGAERLIRLIEKGWLEPKHLGVLVYGQFTKELPPDQVRTLLEHLAKVRTRAAAEAGLSCLAEWWRLGDEVLPAELVPIAWDYLEITPEGRADAMYPYYWARVARKLMALEPKRIAVTIVDMVSSGEIHLGDERFALLKECLSFSPEEVWWAIGEKLDQSIALSLSWTAREDELLDEVDAALLMHWANETDTESRAKILAQLVTPGKSLSELVRSLLVEFGPESSAANILAANFGSGTWWGSMAAREEQQLDIANGWLTEAEPAVRAWAARIADGITRSLPDLRLADEEGRL